MYMLYMVTGSSMHHRVKLQMCYRSVYLRATPFNFSAALLRSVSFADFSAALMRDWFPTDARLQGE
jgi:hypothetical protein